VFARWATHALERLARGGGREGSRRHLAVVDADPPLAEFDDVFEHGCAVTVDA
jgi:hypothetical protein